METTEQRHYAVIDPYKRKLTLSYRGTIIAESSNALILKEVAKSVYDPVFYFPKEDIKVALQQDEKRSSYCPIKGDATYWDFDEHKGDDYIAWSYEKAFPRTKKMEGYIAFNLAQMELVSAPLD